MAFTPTEEAKLSAIITAFESGKTISEIAASTEVFTTDVLEIVQSAVSKKATIAQIITLVNSELGVGSMSTKLSGIEAGAQVNIIESVKVNNTVLPVYSKSVNITVPTQPSDIGAQPEGDYATNTQLATKEPANANIQTHIGSNSNPHNVTKIQVGLGNVDNTSDTTKNNALVILSNKTIDGGTY
jgi:hypothetical protein